MDELSRLRERVAELEAAEVGLRNAVEFAKAEHRKEATMRERAEALRAVAVRLFGYAKKIERPPWAISSCDPETVCRWMQRTAAEAVADAGLAFAALGVAEAESHAAAPHPTLPPSEKERG